MNLAEVSITDLVVCVSVCYWIVVNRFKLEEEFYEICDQLKDFLFPLKIGKYDLIEGKNYELWGYWNSKNQYGSKTPQYLIVKERIGNSYYKVDAYNNGVIGCSFNISKVELLDHFRYSNAELLKEEIEDLLK